MQPPDHRCPGRVAGDGVDALSGGLASGRWPVDNDRESGQLVAAGQDALFHAGPQAAEQDDLWSIGRVRCQCHDGSLVGRRASRGDRAIAVDAARRAADVWIPGPHDRARSCVVAAILAGVIEELGDDVFHIDTRMGGYDGITSSYLIRSSRPCLVETGTARSAPIIVAELAALGVQAEDLATVVVTHIHLDHAGGVGDIAQAFPNAQVVVHERGARHLADPSRLMSSAQRVFGSDLDRLFGELLPVPADRLVVLGEIGTIDLGDGRRLDAFHNPGHASHHIGLLDSATGDLYTGDAAGVYVPQTADVRPATPPPDFDLDLTLSSLDRMRAAGAKRLLFSHFGPVTDVEMTLDRSEEELRRWVEIVAEIHAVTPDLDHAVELVRARDRERHPAFYADDERVRKFDELSGVGANVNGIVRWLERA